MRKGIRVVLTSETPSLNAYPIATMEDGNATTENLYYANITATRDIKPSGFDGNSLNYKVARLTNSEATRQTGPSITLKVNTGDKLNLSVKSFYRSSGMMQVPTGADQLKTLAQTGITMDKSGFFYAYVVNESSMNVYFDDFQVSLQGGKVLEENAYYPFGMLNAQLSAPGITDPKNMYKYNDKELQKELSLEWLDYGARFYDPQIGRFHTVDPLEQYESGNIYGGNNPILMNDPTGMWAENAQGVYKSVVDNTGKIIYSDLNSNDKNIYLSYDGQTGSDGNTKSLEIVGQEQPGLDYSKGRYIIPGTNIPIQNWYPASGRIDEDYTLEELFIFGGSNYKLINYIIKKLKQITVNDILEDAIPGNKTKGPTKQWIKKGGLSKAEKDFKNLQPKNVKIIKTQYGSGKTGELSDGRSITVRPGSSEGSPTIEIRNPNNKKGIEVRYK